MGTRDLPARLAVVQRRFEAWRKAHKARSRIPDCLWGSAVRAAGRYGLHCTAKALRLDYYALKKRGERGTSTRGGLATVPIRTAEPAAINSFVELPSPIVGGGGECLLELENAAGAKMRVHLKGIAMPDLAALSRSFWNPGP